MTAPAARWRLGDAELCVREQDTVLADDALIASVNGELWEQLGFAVRRRPGDPDWRVRTSQFVGIVRLRIGDDQVHLRILPKIDDLDLFFLADWAYTSDRAGRMTSERAALDPVRDDPAACLLGWYINELTRFATRWLRRGYLFREEELAGRIRGRVQVGRYVSGSLARGRAQVIPCHYAEPSHDTAVNRFLKAGLRRAIALSADVPLAAARDALRMSGARALSLFATVTDVRAVPNDVPRLNLNGPLRHYKPIVRLTAAMLSGIFVGPVVGPHVQDAFVWDLNRMFQEALRNILAAWRGASLDSARSVVTVSDSAGRTVQRSRIDPDFVLTTPGGRQLLLDSKYKDALPGGAVEEDDVVTAGRRIKLSRADIYQAVAYSQHDKWRPATVGLVYPVSLRTGETLPAPLHVRRFERDIFVMFIDAGPGAAANLPEFHAALDLVDATM